MSLVLRDVRPWGRAPVDVAIAEGRIAAVGPGLSRGGDEIDGRGGVLLPGLHDHHLHILALAARRHSVDLAGVLDPAGIAARLRAAPAPQVRAVGYDERAAGLPDAALLDSWLPDRPLRLQDRTGALRVLNSAALALLPADLPPGAERDAAGRPNGRFWREDAWLGRALPRIPLDRAALGAELAGLGLAALTDASAHNGPDEAAALAGKLPQRLTLMGSEALPEGEGYTRGPLKLLIDERDPPAPAALAARIATARAQGRAVAAHCVTELELVLYLAALDAAGGAQPGDRIEHGGMIPEALIPVIVRAGLTVVTNPAFLHDRGDRYLSQIDDIADLYRAASLQHGGVTLRGGSDAPYASVDPWRAMRTARDRLTASGAAIGLDERIAAREALSLYSSGSIAVGAPADLTLCKGTLDDVLADLDAGRVELTIVGGEPITARSR